MSKTSGINEDSISASEDTDTNNSELNWVGFCPSCSDFDVCKYTIGDVGETCEECVNMTDNQEGVLCSKFGWVMYCDCANFYDDCYQCYHRKVDEFLEEMQAAKAAIEHVQARREERREVREAGQKNWSIKMVGTCTRCNIVGLVGKTCEECDMPFILDGHYEKWGVLGQW